MISIPVYGANGKKVGQKDVDETAFDGCVRYELLKQVIISSEAARRGGNASTKERSFIRGSTKKPWRQKGTGSARAGSRKSPIWRGGGTVFGPRPRSYAKSIPRKAARKAVRTALLLKLKDGAVKIVKEMAVEKPRTKELVAILRPLNAEKSSVIVVAEQDTNLWLAARNLQAVDVVTADNLDGRMLSHKKNVLMTEEAFDRLQKGDS